MNKQGIGFFYTLMLGTLIIILGLALSSPTKEFVDTSRNETNMNCTNPEINVYDEATCVGLDFMKFLITGGIICFGLAIIGAKVIWG